jgi:hypothetical protein
LRQKPVFRLTTHRFRQLCEYGSVFIVTGKAVRAASEAASKELETATPASEAGSESKAPSAQQDPGFAAVVQAVSSATLQYQTENRVAFQNVVNDLLQSQRVFHTVQDINQALGMVRVALGSFESKVNQWESRFAVFFQQNRPETVGMTTINNLKAQQNKGRIHVRSAVYQFGKLISNLEQAKVNQEPSPKDKA